MTNKKIAEIIKYANQKRRIPFVQPIMTGDVATGGSVWGMSSTAWRGATYTASDGIGFVGGDELRGGNGWQIIMYNPEELFLGGFNYTNGWSDAVPSNIKLEVSNDGAYWTIQPITKNIVGGAGVTWSGLINSTLSFKWLRWTMISSSSSDCSELRLNNCFYYD